MSQSTKSSSAVRAALIIAGLQIAGTLLIAYARQQGFVDGDTATRGVMVLIGLGLAAWGNRMPKALDGPPPTSLAIAALRQGVQRVGGWALTLAGLAHAGLWAFASRDIALVGGIVAVAGASLVVCGSVVWCGITLHRSTTS